MVHPIRDMRLCQTLDLSRFKLSYGTWTEWFAEWYATTSTGCHYIRLHLATIASHPPPLCSIEDIIRTLIHIYSSTQTHTEQWQPLIRLALCSSAIRNRTPSPWFLSHIILYLYHLMIHMTHRNFARLPGIRSHTLDTILSQTHMAHDHSSFMIPMCATLKCHSLSTWNPAVNWKWPSFRISLNSSRNSSQRATYLIASQGQHTISRYALVVRYVSLKWCVGYVWCRLPDLFAEFSRAWNYFYKEMVSWIINIIWQCIERRVF